MHTLGNNSVMNRELSWLSFNERVLNEAADNKVPILQRMRFLGIFSNNLDEFFRIRVASMRTPIGVIGFICESRPNVTAYAGALCLKSGNAVLLRGGSEAFHSKWCVMFHCRLRLSISSLYDDLSKLCNPAS